MSVAAANNTVRDPLPQLRQELSLHEGAPTESGAPTWTLQDPVRNQFFRIEWLPFEILSRWHWGDAATIIAAIEQETTLNASVEDVAMVLRFMHENELLEQRGATGTTFYTEKARQRRSGVWTWLLHHYLFFRIPLVRPDAWLERLQPWVVPLYSLRFLWLTLTALLLGMVEVSRQWEHFVATLVDTFSLRGALGFGVALIVTKTLHELGHAFTAKHYGCRVPVIGVAFIVLWPLAYTDVNEVWKLRSRKQRLVVGAAGITVELAIAAWATLAWALLPDGMLRGVAFMLATTTWIATLAINASPFLRFDGYFLLCDMLDMPNLHPRAFALARWRLRELLFGLGEPPPEYLGSKRRRGLILFAWATWIYRLVVFFGIAVLVYHMFAKAIGLVLGAVEVGWFILLPVWRELQVLLLKWPQIRSTRRSRQTAWLSAGLIALAAMPLSFQIQTQGILKSAQSFPLIATVSGQLVSPPPPSGTVVAGGHELMRIESPDLQWRTLVGEARSTATAWAAQAAALDPEMQPRLLVMRRESMTTAAALEGDRREVARLVPTAPFSGVLVDVPPDLSAGTWVARHEKLGTLIDPTQWRVETYLTEEAITRVSVGDTALFLPETAGRGSLALRVEQIDRDATRSLPDGILGSPHGGALMARERGSQIVPVRAIYRVALRVTDPLAADIPAQRGQVVIYASPTTLLGDYLRSVAGLLVRESGV
ncbi:MAG: HlyD family efflux transporter periplasmic adaptor subunit [Sulfuritalea sp.]|jgi:putative peptide zinc metalloprotease protein|nr:HlyD family efflux transporter periplasmic adaptor subunit [Sulfuritalea sp.]